MRYFPSAARRRLLTLAVSTLAVGALAVPLAYAVDGGDLKDKQKHVHAQVEQAQTDADEASHEVSTATAALQAAQADLVTTRNHLYAARAHVADVRAQLKVARAEDERMQGELDAAQARLTQAQADVVAGQAALAAQRVTVTDTIVGLYQQGSPQLLALSGYLDAQTPDDLTRKMEYADTLVEDQNTAFDALHAAEVQLTVREGQVRDAEAQVATQRADAAQQFAATQALRDQAEAAKADAQHAKDDVATTVARRHDAQVAAKAARRHDLVLLAKLKKQEQRIKQQILAAAAQDTSVGYTGSDNGFLLPPVVGPVTSPFGYRIHPIYGYWGLHDGTDFGVSCGEGMRAAADGRVISQYYSSVYGNRLYLDVGKVNGHNLTVVYNHATGYRVGVGDTVKRGEIVGYVGSTGWSTGCHLHFTVLQDGVAVDPMNYL